MPEAQEKIALVTGATSGIGFAIARELAARGFRVFLHGRTLEKARDAAARIPFGAVTPLYADLAEQSAVRRLADDLLGRTDRLDVLVNNAGVWNSERVLTVDGVETTFAVNHLAYFLLTGLLLPLLRPNGRVICLASDSHKQVPRMHFADLSLAGRYHGLRSYAQSKLANVLFCYEYDRRKQDATTIAAVQPGLVQTDIGLKGNTWLHRLAWRVRRQMRGNKSPAEGAATAIFLATVEGNFPSGLYWDDGAPKASYSSSYDGAEAARLWEESEALTGFRYEFPNLPGVLPGHPD